MYGKIKEYINKVNQKEEITNLLKNLDSKLL